MDEYEVTFHATYTTTVYANSHEEAADLAYDEIAGGDWDNIEATATKIVEE